MGQQKYLQQIRPVSTSRVFNFFQVGTVPVCKISAPKFYAENEIFLLLIVFMYTTAARFKILKRINF